ncbi:hypothetical protein DB31_8940 [Hyalangium minutum]|uniref:Uncharacterized protein n=1 Tax=Hyalangium minutum TaxID=394096 RepID=A0A085WGB3_9BACT|nr:hypothetical protein DB31_8940 [Hyalangium minutum]
MYAQRNHRRGGVKRSQSLCVNMGAAPAAHTGASDKRSA